MAGLNRKKVTGLASNRESDELLYGKEGRVVGGNSPEAKAAFLPVDHGKTTNIEQEQPKATSNKTVYTNVHGGVIGGIGRREGSTEAQTPRVGAQEPVKTAAQEAEAKFNFMPPVNPTAEQFKQYDYQQGLKSGRHSKPLDPMRNMKSRERIAYRNTQASVANNTRNNETDLSKVRIGGQNAIGLQKNKFAFAGSESNKQRQFLGGQNDLDRQQTTEQGELNRESAADQQRAKIGGQAFLAGVGGNDVQQIENSTGGNINYAGLQVPQKRDTSSPYRMVEETDEDGVSRTTGSFNQRTGEFVPRIGEQQPEQPSMVHELLGGMDPGNPTPDQKAYLINLAKNNPKEYQRLRQMR